MCHLYCGIKSVPVLVPVQVQLKGLFTRSDAVSDSVTVKFYNCANGDRPSDGQNGCGTHSARQMADHY